ncbi:hypothetical protein BE20_01620 [Sorangium cellulosum]|nr:hypothetical protein BE20_01620 [Sorangium cellulosum]
MEPRWPAPRSAPWSRVDRAAPEGVAASAAPSSLAPSALWDFARIRVTPRVQRAPSLGPPGLGDEREAGEVAGAADRGGLTPSAAPPAAAGVQRKCAACEDEDEHAGAMQRAADGSGLGVGPADDAYEREADRVASEVMSGAQARVLGRVGNAGAQRDAGGAGGGFAAPSIVGEVLRSGGAPLDASTRAFMEARMGHDFGDVRIHADARADASARAVNALAYTVGRDIAFRSGQYDPASDRGRRLLAHELAHVCQQGAASIRGGRLDAGAGERPGQDARPAGEPPRPAPHARASVTASPLLQRQHAPSGGPVTGVRISCEDRRIVFDTGGVSHPYRLTSCEIPVGDYTVGVSIRGAAVHFDFGQSAERGERFRFGFHIDPDQVNPVTLFRRQTRVAVSVVERLPSTEVSTSTPSGPAPLASRLAAFQRLVKSAGKLRLAENGRALEQWRQFLEQQLTPAQVQAQVHAEEVRALLDAAGRRGELALAEQWLRTRGANRRWVLEQQIDGRYRACTGCHATVQAEAMDRARAERGEQLRAPLEQLAAGADPGPRPAFAAGEQVATSEQPRGLPAVAEAQERINTLRPYLRELGPEGYRVLPAETLGSAAPPGELLADIGRRIARRQADYREFSSRIDAPDFDYLTLRPIVRDLLPLADADVRQAVLQAIDRAETWETVESIVVGAASIGLLLLAIFPPTSALGIAGALALGTGMSAHQVYRGYQSFEQGRLYALGRGAHDVLDPAQQEAADSLMALGALNMVLGTVGLASGALGSVRLIRSLPPAGGGLGAVEAVEGTAGGTLYRVTGWGTRDPRVVVIGPNGRVIREGPLSSFRPRVSGPSASGRAQASARASSGATGGHVYPTEGGAARVAQPVPVTEPVPTPEVVPQPVPAPAARPGGAVRPPSVRGPLAVMGGATAVDAITSVGRPGQQPAVPSAPVASSERPLPRWEPSPGESHPTHEEVQDAANERSTDCDALAYAIDVLIRDLRFRRWDMQRNSGGDARHRSTYRLRQEALRRLVQIARALDCAYDAEADAELSRPHTHPTPRY